MEQLSYWAFSADLHQRQSGQRAPMQVSIEVTRRCPLECQHCYNNLPMGDQDARSREMTTEEHFHMLDELVEAGCLWLLYTGGEIFARKDFLEIYTEAKKRGFLITLFTNGTMINERIANYLAEYRPFAIEITLYGATRETYEALTQIPGSYDRCMRGIRMLLDRKLPLKLKTVPTTVNRHEVYEMHRMAQQDFGVDFKFDPLVNPRIDCSQRPVELRLPPEDAVGRDLHDARRRAEALKLIERDMALPADAFASENIYQCGGGLTSCAIDPYGQISICVLSHQESYDWRSGSFSAGWDDFLGRVRGKKKTRQSKCDACRTKTLCGMCAANGELEKGDAESPVEFLCEVAHLRTMALGIEIPAHGDCECCAGGIAHDKLLQSAERIRKGEVDVGSWTPTPTAATLPILQQSSGCGSGCGSCGAHA